MNFLFLIRVKLTSLSWDWLTAKKTAIFLIRIRVTETKREIRIWGIIKETQV